MTPRAPQLSFNLVGDDVRRLILFRAKKVRASLRRLLQCKDRAHTISFRATLALTIAISICGACASAADDPAAAFDAANKLYEQGKFAEATSGYENIAQAGAVSAGVYFNLGNARFKSGEVGRAIASYRQAEALAPRDPDVRANLQFVRGQIQGPTQPPDRVRRWLGALTLNEWTLFASVAVWLWLLLLAWRQWQPALKRALRGLVLATGAATLIVGLCLGMRLFLDSVPTVVVISHDAAVRTGPLEDSRTAFTVHDGAELSVLDQKDDWLQVSAGGQWLGWLQRDQVLSLSHRSF
jgi:tetratricopeptide (TPR) repeat protein